MKVRWKGIFPAVTTKFTPNDSLDFNSFDKSIQAQIEAGVDGIIIGGSLGEASTLTDGEKISLVEHTIKLVNNKIPVIYTIADQITKSAVLNAQKVIDKGASGLMLLPPMRYKADSEETVTFFKEVAKSINLPIMIYNNPIDYGINVTLEMFDQLAEYDNIQAVKESTRDVSNITRMINKFGNRYSILTGVDTLAMESLVMGADGWVAGLVNAFPKETVSVYRLIKAGKYQEALAIYRWFFPVLELDIHTKLVQYIKLAEVATGLGTETVRAPRLTIKDAERKNVLQIINQALATRPELPAGSWGY
ncbi:MAG: dihydrodipicolinate synthase family protein [Mucilaginibacter sp.]|nr:dihydrodipicolinate synthase family protein [Mucilaginibacter sp.]